MKDFAELMLLCCVAAVLFSCGEKESANEYKEAPTKHLYVTWESLEVDKLASIWLMKRFIDPEAEFRFVPKGTIVKGGIPFDTPDAEYRRYHSISCFQSILKKHNVTDPALVYIGEITHDIEVNFWAEKRLKESVPLRDKIIEIINTNGARPEACVQYAKALFDDLYETLGSSGGRGE